MYRTLLDNLFVTHKERRSLAQSFDLLLCEISFKSPNRWVYCKVNILGEPLNNSPYLTKGSATFEN